MTIIPVDVTERGSYAFRKGEFSYAQIFNKLILNFKERGYYLERLEQKYGSSRNCERNPESLGMQAQRESYSVNIEAVQV